ncbi:unnamed protein product [[Actinomadura] parvosata subsp. kistnae]|uniref:Uncharacterized protein n=1 Tax=[Actinomadura] parvosata subsp. kistnae TaxID=1909395 RepID=A0A1V0A925_9ACTN|nr:hypothetical protein [Nonomuraea sp. ATCC 55076]AQZ66734.1 hypothetical protein BKM31_39545 [Nonomuraea sp. ATCC 55076]SPL95148.1 unnamed protein product [Actinomadura parvosata subsp. kistnae]
MPVTEIARVRAEIEERTRRADLTEITAAAVLGDWNIGTDDHDPARRVQRRRMIRQAFQWIRIKRPTSPHGRRPAFDPARVVLGLREES